MAGFKEAITGPLYIAKAMLTTFKHNTRPIVTISYPERQKQVPPRERGRHILHRYADGLEKCVGCELCAIVCPVGCIVVEAAENTPEHRVSPGERYARRYEINLLRCIYCGVCEKACPSIDVTAANGFEAQRLDAVEKLLPRLELIDIRRRRPARSFVDVTRIVQPVAEARMRFQSRSIGQVDSMRRDIVNGRPSIVAGRRAGCETSCITKNATFRSRVCDGRPRRLRHAKKLLEKRAIIGERGWENGLSVLLR